MAAKTIVQLCSYGIKHKEGKSVSYKSLLYWCHRVAVAEGQCQHCITSQGTYMLSVNVEKQRSFPARREPTVLS